VKKTIKGVTYDTERSKFISSLGGTGYGYNIHQDRKARFFAVETRFRVNGRLVPRNKDSHELVPDLDSLDPTIREKAKLRVTVHEKVIPLTRRQVIAIHIRACLPRTFHKDLARFLK
jgi:hypothetical protein